MHQIMCLDYWKKTAKIYIPVPSDSSTANDSHIVTWHYRTCLSCFLLVQDSYLNHISISLILYSKSQKVGFTIYLLMNQHDQQLFKTNESVLLRVWNKIQRANDLNNETTWEF